MQTLKQILTVAALGFAGAASAQTTAFTYQGKLTDDCCPATGLYDLTFKLFDSAGPGATGQQGSTVTTNRVPVTNGLFTVRLDFGSAPFTGARRWLQIDARTNNAALTPVTLLPRTELTPTPYALYAANAGSGGGSGPWQINGTHTYYNAGNVGIGTMNPSSKFHISGGHLTLDNGDNVSSVLQSDGDLVFRMDRDNDDGDTAINFQRATGAFLMSLRANGNVGIGTSTPEARLTLASGSTIKIKDPEHASFGTFLGADSVGNAALAVAGRNLSIYSGWENTLQLGHVNYDASGGKVIFPGGNVGIGTTSPQSKLHVNGTIRVGGDSANYAYSSQDGNGLFLEQVGSSPSTGKMRLQSSRSGARTAYSQFFIDPENGFSFLGAGGANGSVGIGTTSPKGALHVASGGIAVTGRTSPYLGAGAGVFMESDGTQAFLFAYDYNTFTPQPLHLNSPGGMVSVPVLQITGGGDLAEPFDVSEKDIPKGAVVVIDEENPGQLRMSDRAYDNRVAGIISGANGVKPGIMLKQEGTLEGTENVALTGRVYALADASESPIKPGDLLTTSATPGHCMKASDRDRAHGAIIGKAMTGLKEGKGHVLVLVNLQ
jgi:hypothetical protein